VTGYVNRDGSISPLSAQERRARRVSANRERMVTAATQLFSTVGFAGTTMDAVAIESEMSVQSVYFNFHSKANLLQAAFDQAALESGAPPPLTEWYRAAVREPDANVALKYFVEGNCRVLATTGPLTLAAASANDSLAAAIYERNEELRRGVLADMTSQLAGKRRLRDRLTIDRAADIVFGLISPQLYGLLTRTRGWNHDEYAKWVGEALRRELWE
jgi:AcrR family transcriptional regulator